MELLAYSIIKLICKEAASGTYNGALEILQKMMSECKYHEGNAFVIMGAGEQLKRIKYDANENKLKVYNVHFDNNQELVADGEPDVVFLKKTVWEDLLVKQSWRTKKMRFLKLTCHLIKIMLISLLNALREMNRPYSAI
ncbi:hypothetical protein ECSTECC16502_3307 [Escherichia coli STEC_C165-02]|nr:hypothetical protein ECSTECC16502_3307 [Escherichia coli STEC_C165-02]